MNDDVNEMKSLESLKKERNPSTDPRTGKEINRGILSSIIGLELSASTTAQQTSDIIPRKYHRFIVSTVVFFFQEAQNGETPSANDDGPEKGKILNP